MFGTILVHIPTELPVRPALNGSISLAVSTGAHLDATAIGYERTIMPLIATGGAPVTSIFEVEHDRALKRAEAAIRVFDREARNAGISYATRAVSAVPSEARALLCASARVHDVTIVTQPRSDHDSYDNVMPSEILFRAGGPVLFMPYAFHSPFSAKRIGICWDSSRLAARAVHDAMPLLRKADALTIIMVTGRGTVSPESSCDHLVTHLARLGLAAKVTSVLPVRRSKLQSILSRAMDDSFDLIVMSACSSSWLHGKLLGRMRRDLLRSMTVPTLMSH
ncbi:universal stress protein [Bradyrhizobium sp. ORS 86]|uniref:universal stress protein n=2 Tax=unclassified Bradyrhizobium TaxID=2631580 RepID=UPI00388D136C